MKFNILLICVVSIIAAVVSSEKGGDEVVIDETRERRDISVNVASSFLRVESKLRGGKGIGKIQFEMKLDGPPRCELRYKSVKLVDDTMDFLRSRIVLLGLSEVNGTTGIRTSPNRLVFTDGLGPVWTSLRNGISESTIDGISVKSITTSLVFPADHARFPNFNLTLQAFVSDGNITRPGFQVSPTGFKYSVIITNWPFKLQNSRLALLSAFFTKSNEFNFESAQKKFVLDGGLVSYKWNETVVADGILKPVNISSEFALVKDNMGAVDETKLDNDHAEDVAHLVAFLFPRAQVIDWDPELTMNNPENAYADMMNTGTKTAVVPGNSMIVLGALFYALFVL